MECRQEAASGRDRRSQPPCLLSPTGLPAKVVQATVHFFTRLEVCKNY